MKIGPGEFQTADLRGCDVEARLAVPQIAIERVERAQGARGRQGRPPAAP